MQGCNSMHYRLPETNLKRYSVAANALISGAFSVGNIIGPQLFQPKDAPQYIPAKIILLVTEIATAMFALALRIYYGWQNKVRDAAARKEREAGEVKEVANVEWLNCKCVLGLSGTCLTTLCSNRSRK